VTTCNRMIVGVQKEEERVSTAEKFWGKGGGERGLHSPVQVRGVQQCEGKKGERGCSQPIEKERGTAKDRGNLIGNLLRDYRTPRRIPLGDNLVSIYNPTGNSGERRGKRKSI